MYTPAQEEQLAERRERISMLTTQMTELHEERATLLAKIEHFDRSAKLVDKYVHK